jgi:hypothetical protein
MYRLFQKYVTVRTYFVIEIAVSTVTRLPIPVAAQSKAWVYDGTLPGIAGSNPSEGMDVRLL